MRTKRSVVVYVFAAILPACGGNDPAAPTPSPSPTPSTCAAGPIVTGTPALTSQLVVSGLHNPLDLQSAAGDRERLYVVEQGGGIRVIRNGQLAGALFLDVSGIISTGGERGLLGLAFHPQFATNRRFFVNYTNRAGDTHISEFHATSADAADIGSERVLMEVIQPFANHNGGGLAFGNDGYLYIGLGDGGSAGDPQGNGQSLSTALGKILRVDVDHAQPFAVPADNPFATRAGAIPAIWAYGLRNPWRFGFDRATGDLYIGDVGQNRLEEVDIGFASHRGGENYGWNTMEGEFCFRPANNCDRTGLTLPVLDYDHTEGCSITGGFVYRGCRMPGYAGTFFYGDYCSALIRSFRYANGQVTEQRDHTATVGRGVINSVSSFGVDADGEPYVVDYDGEIYRIVPAS
jgi:glucose/arabinose dehydrogenase